MWIFFWVGRFAPRLGSSLRRHPIVVVLLDWCALVHVPLMWGARVPSVFCFTLVSRERTPRGGLTRARVGRRGIREYGIALAEGPRGLAWGTFTQGPRRQGWAPASTRDTVGHSATLLCLCGRSASCLKSDGAEEVQGQGTVQGQPKKNMSRRQNRCEYASDRLEDGSCIGNVAADGMVTAGTINSRAA